MNVKSPNVKKFFFIKFCYFGFGLHLNFDIIGFKSPNDEPVTPNFI